MVLRSKNKYSLVGSHSKLLLLKFQKKNLKKKPKKYLQTKLFL